MVRYDKFYLNWYLTKNKGHGGIEPLEYDLQSNRTTLYNMSLEYYTFFLLIKNMYICLIKPLHF